MGNEVIACTLAERERAERGDAWGDLRGAGLIETRVEGGFFTSTWQPAVRRRLAQLVEAEKRCCAFIDFDEVAERDGPLVLRAAFPPGAEEIGRRLFGVSSSSY